MTRDVAYDHSDFGKAFPCPECGGPVDLNARLWRTLEKHFAEYWMFGSSKMGEYDIDAFMALPDSLATGKHGMVWALYHWGRGELLTYEGTQIPDPTFAFEPSNALVLSGAPGLGKTCGAAAAFEMRRGVIPGLAIEYNALVSAIQDKYGDTDEDSGAAKRAAAQARFLFLDDLGNVNLRGPEKDDRVKIVFEILNHRYNWQLPTIITTNLSADHLMEQFGHKLQRRLRSWPLWVDVRGAGLDVRPGV